MPSPINYYGRSKLQGESAIRQRLPDAHLIVRAGWMIGGGLDYDHKFVGKVVKQMRAGAPELRAVPDKLGTLTAASLLAKFIITALNGRLTGTFHFCSAGVVSRFDVAQAIAELFSYQGKLVAVPSSLFPLSAPRPQSEGIETIYSSVSGMVARPWRTDLSAYLAEFE